MEPWDGWETGRVVVLFAALMYVGMWMQLSLYHWSAAFRKWEMWGPVLVTPLIVVAAVLAGVQRDGILGWIGLAGLAVGALEGMGGFFLHLRGISSYVGGFSLRNAMAGPPPVLPMAYALAGVLGLIGLLWNA